MKKKNEQLEFNFIENIIIKKSFIDFIIQHIKPQIGWVTESGEQEDKWNGFNNIWKNVIDHLKIGLSFKWKF